MSIIGLGLHPIGKVRAENSFRNITVKVRSARAAGMKLRTRDSQTHGKIMRGIVVVRISIRRIGLQAHYDNHRRQ